LAFDLGENALHGFGLDLLLHGADPQDDLGFLLQACFDLQLVGGRRNFGFFLPAAFLLETGGFGFGLHLKKGD
jgi:hypothetical protein